MTPKPFPAALLKITSCTMYDIEGPVIMCAMADFQHDPSDNGEMQCESPSLGFDPLNTDGRLSRDLAGTVLRFPVNPAPGYWEGSLGLEGEMVPLDVTEVAFAIRGDDVLVARLTVQLRFDPGQTGLTPYSDTDWSFDLHLPVGQFDDIISGRAGDRSAASKQARLARKLAERRQKS